MSEAAHPRTAHSQPRRDRLICVSDHLIRVSDMRRGESVARIRVSDLLTRSSDLLIGVSDVLRRDSDYITRERVVIFLCA